mmetsp:Transcript_41645/g.75584  ORF Transcript_41645/g.75584 Transcript_41645/m.75584 type:complete len:228 (+) Transcript_41645:786-1469(+)
MALVASSSAAGFALIAGAAAVLGRLVGRLFGDLLRPERAEGLIKLASSSSSLSTLSSVASSASSEVLDLAILTRTPFLMRGVPALSAKSLTLTSFSESRLLCDLVAAACPPATGFHHPPPPTALSAGLPAVGSSFLLDCSTGASGRWVPLLVGTAACLTGRLGAVGDDDDDDVDDFVFRAFRRLGTMKPSSSSLSLAEVTLDIISHWPRCSFPESSTPCRATPVFTL